MKLDDLIVYQKAMMVGESCWTIVASWDYFQKDTIGKQLVKADDSVAANISEGFGRYHYKENIHFNYIARGSLFETKTWIEKARNRNLINETDSLKLSNDINEIARLLNTYISKIGKNIASEPETKYGNFYGSPSDYFENPFSSDLLTTDDLFSNDQ